MAEIYVMALDSGCDGHSPPVQAFNDLSTAKAAMAIAKANACGSCWQLYRVPLWPERAPSYLDIKPLEI